MKKKNLLQRAIIIAVVTLLGLYIVVGPRHRPTAQDFTWNGIKKTLGENIRLGLDLKGGSHLVMRVKVEEFLKTLTENNALAVQNAAKAQNFPIKEARADISGGNYRVVLEVTDPSKISDIQSEVEKKVDLSGWTASASGNTVTWTLTPTAERTLTEQATDQAQKIIESRLNQFGVAEPLVQRHGAQGSHQILVQMPGIQDPERVKILLAGTSKLELVHVVSPPSPASVQTYASEEEAKASLGGTVPANRRILPYQERMEPTSAGSQPADQNKPKRYVVIETPAVVDGSELRNASAVQSRAGGNDYQIAFSLKPTGADKFGAWTGANINEYMGVVLENEVKSVAYIKSQITDSGEIEGRFTKQSADDLALTLRSGALPAPIEYQEERTVGPSLGADSIRSGVLASVVGLALVVAFMLFYYRGSGINAVVALLLNMILMMAALIIFGATLTLPGIAGIILTIGMAVDSNVLIFERIREELHTGKTVPSAVEQGFARAFVTIIDTHVTTTVSSLFLFVFGTGPIRGFAVTLILGLIVNLFTSVYVSRTIFIWLLSRKGRKVETLSI
ncbi:MAG: protein-export membrane protein SecD [Acidobacteria bacterium 13_1_20CM_3_53_8]|nr:MAG: protein-export membrane protein SecD [Acidobacteria bacterium 13_1_20CM_3_53_8]